MCNRDTLKETFKPALDSHLTKFPNSTVGVKTSGLSDKLIHIVTAIFSSDMHGCTIHNDPFHTMFTIEQIGDDQFELTIPNGLGLLINPRPHESYLAYSIVKLAFRKTKGNAKKILAKINEVQEKQLALVLENRSEIKGFEQSNLTNI